MAERPERKRVGTWQERVDKAQKVKDEWWELYQVDKLAQYYYGHQTEDPQSYAINLVFPTVEIRIPRLLFAKPKAKIEPRPTKADDPMSQWDERVKLMNGTMNTVMDARSTRFKESPDLALKEAFFAFGIIQSVYSSESTDNPNAGKPMLYSDEGPGPNGQNPEKAEGYEPKVMKDKAGNTVIEPERIVTSEKVYCKWIPAKQFLVPADHKNILEENDWVAYYEWMWPEDAKSNKTWKNTSYIKESGSLSSKYKPQYPSDDESKDGMLKIWRLWDLRTRKHYIWCEGSEKFHVDGEPFKKHGFSDLRFHSILGSFYPVPPVYNWLHPQDELNETRNAQRIHRRRFARRWSVLKGALDPGELEALKSNEDGVYAIVNRHDAIQAIEDAPLDRAVYANAPATKEDFMMISNVGGEQRGASEAETATQANIIEQNLSIRDSYGREQIARWLGDILYRILNQLRDNQALDFIIFANVDVTSPNAPMEALRVGKLWKQLAAGGLGDFDFEVNIDVESLSPAATMETRRDWNEALTLFSNPTLMMLMVTIPPLLEKTLRQYNITSDEDIKMFQAGMSLILGQMQAMAQGAGPEGKGKGGVAAPGAVPGQGAINAGTQKQLTGPGGPG